MAKRYRESWEFPKGVDSFEKLRTKGCVYIDKTDLIYRLVSEEAVFLSRPRRFGKSLLCSTLEAYFLGQKELFEGLAIANLEKEWVQHPVFRFDISGLKDKSPEFMQSELFMQLERSAEANGLDMPEKTTPGRVFQTLVERAYKKTGKRAVIIIDEYDSVLLHLEYGTELYDKVQEIHREFFITCKKCSQYLRFVFITGITKFSQVSIFSSLNNLTNISMERDYATLCGISEKELHDVFDDDVENLANTFKVSQTEMYALLKKKYDGFHFCEDSEGVYNPYSLMRVFGSKRLDSYWFDTATPSALFKLLSEDSIPLLLDSITASVDDFSVSIHDQETAIPLLYQSGYLTIKGYNQFSRAYTLGVPNEEVRVGLCVGLMSYLKLTKKTIGGIRSDIVNGLLADDVDVVMNEIKSFFSKIPYLQVTKNNVDYEALHERDMQILLTAIDLPCVTQYVHATGRIDMVIEMPNTIFIFEFKMDTNGTVDDALMQIDQKGYALPFANDPRPICKVGVQFDHATHTLGEWKSVMEK